MSGAIHRTNIVSSAYLAGRSAVRAALFGTALMVGTICGCQKYETYETRSVTQGSEFLVIQLKKDPRLFFHAGTVAKVDETGIEVLNKSPPERERFSYGTTQVTERMRVKVDRGEIPGTAKVTFFMVEGE